MTEAMTDDERRGFDPAGYNSELIVMRSGPVEVVRYHNRAHVEISRPLSADQAVRIFETVSAIVRSDIRNDESGKEDE